VRPALCAALALWLLSGAAGMARAQQGDTEPPAAVEADPSTVAALCRRARLGDASSQYELAWIFSHARAEERRDDWAHYLFFAAAGNGHEDARKVLLALTWPQAEVPDCIRRPALSSVPTTALRAPPHIERLVQQLAPQFNVNPKLALAIIAVESNFDSAALSNKNAMGLMQLIPDTARRFGVRNAFDPQQNIRGGMAYLRWLLAYYQGDVRLVAAAYNAGEGAVDKHRGIPPFAETQEYVKRVVARFGSAPHPFDARVAPPSRQMSGVTGSTRAPHLR
jgi:soluble lytic murein transglycosylase-like protein